MSKVIRYDEFLKNLFCARVVLLFSSVSPNLMVSILPEARKESGTHTHTLQKKIYDVKIVYLQFKKRFSNDFQTASAANPKRKFFFSLVTSKQ